MNIVAFVIIAVLITVVVTIVIEQKNKSSYKIEELAKEIISKRVVEREEISPDKLMRDEGVPEDIIEKGEKILKAISQIYGFSADRIRLNDTLEKVSKVHLEELEVEHHEKWKKCIRSDELVLNIDKVFSFLEQSSTKKNWPEFNPKQNNEGEWLDLIATLQIKDIVLYWGPILD